MVPSASPVRPPCDRPAAAARPAADRPEVVEGPLPPGHPLRGAVLLLGNFDGMHLGHRALLGLACRIAQGRPVAVMSCEPHPRSFFGTEALPFRLTTPACKPPLLASCGADFLYAPRFDGAFAALSPVEFADAILHEALGVSQVIAGPDFRFGKGRAGDVALLARLGRSRGYGTACLPEVAPAGRRASSTLIRGFIRAGEMDAAVEMLGAGWLVETRRRADGGLMLHPDLCRPKPGRYLASRAAGRGGPMPVEIRADGGFVPLRPHPVPGPAELWRLHARG